MFEEDLAIFKLGGVTWKTNTEILQLTYDLYHHVSCKLTELYTTNANWISKLDAGLPRDRWRTQWQRSSTARDEHLQHKLPGSASRRRSRPNWWHCLQHPRCLDAACWSSTAPSSTRSHSTPSSQTPHTLQSCMHTDTLSRYNFKRQRDLSMFTDDKGASLPASSLGSEHGVSSEIDRAILCVLFFAFL